MDRMEDIKLLLAEEQTLLSRERTMHSYMQTGLAFSSVGLLIIESGKRYMRFRKAIAALREKEAKLGYDIGVIK